MEEAMDEPMATVQGALAALADPDAARAMAAYMKTDMPFHGVKAPQRRPLERMLRERFPPADERDYVRVVRGLWDLPHREEKYLALAYARQFPRYVTPAHLELYLALIREGAWWDFVDEIAAHLVGHVWRRHRSLVSPLADTWIGDDDLWVRRTAIIGQLRHGEETDTERLFAYCLRRAHEREFFIRKAIGWALRQHGDVDPDAVVAFLREHGHVLSGLSRREASRKLVAAGRM